MADYFVHESSYVDAGARIGKDTKIWHFCHVMPGAVIGERCSLGQNVVVMPGTRIGNNVKIQNNVSIYEGVRSEEHTSELQSHSDLVCRLLLEKKKKKSTDYNTLKYLHTCKMKQPSIHTL